MSMERHNVPVFVWQADEAVFDQSSLFPPAKANSFPLLTIITHHMHPRQTQPGRLLCVTTPTA